MRFHPAIGYHESPVVVARPPARVNFGISFKHRCVSCAPCGTPGSTPACTGYPAVVDISATVGVARPLDGTKAIGYPTDNGPIITIHMRRQEPPCAWKMSVPGRKKSTVEFVAPTRQADMESEARVRYPPPSTCHSFATVTMCAPPPQQEGGNGLGAL